jgi:Flp pilus assembly protein TadG
MIMSRYPHKQARRRAATVPLFAILLVPVLGMLAFSIDLGWIALVKTDLQTAADAAALAGAEKLMNLYVGYTLPGQTQQGSILTTATTNSGTQECPMWAAETVANRNTAGNVHIAVRDQDVTFGFTDQNGAYHSNYSSYNGGFPNTITVITRRDSTANTPVPLFFGRIFNYDCEQLEATATATIYSQPVMNLQVNPWLTTGQSIGAHILPVALDVNIWNYFYTGNGDPTKIGQSPDGQIHLASNGSPELFIYPNGPWALDPTGNGGSFGLLDVGLPANNVPAFRQWIDDGQTPNDISYLISNNLVPVSMPGSGLVGPEPWKCGPGLKDTLLSNFQAQMYEPNLIPLFIPQSAPAGWQSLTSNATSSTQYLAGSSSGQGNTYAIVGFVGVMISQADADGSNMNISIQPSAVVDPTASMPNPQPVGTQFLQFGSGTTIGPVITTFVSPKLTQ